MVQLNLNFFNGEYKDIESKAKGLSGKLKVLKAKASVVVISAGVAGTLVIKYTSKVVTVVNLEQQIRWYEAVLV